jgi:hypothetical protein
LVSFRLNFSHYRHGVGTNTTPSVPPCQLVGQPTWV